MIPIGKVELDEARDAVLAELAALGDRIGELDERLRQLERVPLRKVINPNVVREVKRSDAG